MTIARRFCQMAGASGQQGQFNLNAGTGTGSDAVRGGSGNDQITGMAGDDVLFGDEGNDRIYGDGPTSNADALIYTPSIQHGRDILYGGIGNDRAELLSVGVANDSQYRNFSTRKAA